VGFLFLTNSCIIKSPSENGIERTNKMPNHVYTTLQVNGSPADVEAFIEKAAKPYTSYHKGKQVELADGTFKYDADILWEREETDEIMFWNFIRPEDEVLDIYWGRAEEPKPEGYEEMSDTEKFAWKLKFSGNGWYDWNVRNWGTKWDAYDQDGDEEMEVYASGAASKSYRFATAWGIPEEVFRAMTEQHPELEFYFYSEEEQGWGAEMEGKEGELTTTKTWDIPESHEDHLALDRDCWACEGDEEDDWYADCPKAIEAAKKSELSDGSHEEPDVVYSN
jgi:hypothetical protein